MQQLQLQELHERFTFYSENYGGIGECWLDFFQHEEKWYAILTDLKDNPGPSVINACEEICSNVVQLLGVSEPKEIIFVERIAPESYYREISTTVEILSKVELIWHGSNAVLVGFDYTDKEILFGEKQYVLGLR